MFLSEAIKKRQQVLEKAEAMDKWAKEQMHGTQELKWYEMKVAVNAVINKVYDEWHELNNAIERDIKQLEIEILPFNVK